MTEIMRSYMEAEFGFMQSVLPHAVAEPVARNVTVSINGSAWSSWIVLSGQTRAASLWCTAEVHGEPRVAGGLRLSVVPHSDALIGTSGTGCSRTSFALRDCRSLRLSFPNHKALPEARRSAAPKRGGRATMTRKTWTIDEIRAA